jgi:hypothetical protein
MGTPPQKRKPNTITRRPVKRPPVAQPPVRTSNKADAATPTPSANKPLTGAEASLLIKRQASDLIMKDKEIKLLKDQLIARDEKLKQIKGIAVHMASTSSKNATIPPRMLFDWGEKILGIINRKK